MKRYWDFEERERAEMTMEQVEALLTAELMVAGIVMVERPETLPTETPEIPGIEVYGIKARYSVCKDFAFRTADDAAVAVALMIPIGSEYIAGNTFAVESERSDKISIEPFLIHSKADLANQKSLAEKIASNKKQNETTLAHYQKQLEASDKVCSGVWANWRQCQNQMAMNRRVMKTLADYTATCDGDKAMALKFLAKAFDVEAIHEARTWLDPDYSEGEMIADAHEIQASPALAIAADTF